MAQHILSLILSIPGLLLALTFHEFAHGYVAYLMGDNTAKYDGRLSLNPMHHMDLVGTLCLLFFRFGWAKPVPINPNNFKDRKWGTIAVSLAGPFANFLLAIVCTLLYKLIEPFVFGSKIAEFFYIILYLASVMNVGLMVFNLIPIPPLDGSKVLMEFLPYKARYKMYTIERYSGFILIILLYTNILSPLLALLRNWVFSFIDLILFFI
jgi:Zn-dependent protease